MKKYALKCTCGHVDTVEAASREEAVAMLKEKWTAEVITAHMNEKHPGEPMMTKDMADGHIEKDIVEVMESPSTVPAM